MLAEVKLLRSPKGMSLPEVLIASVILAILVPVVLQTYTVAIHTQTRRAIQEEAVIFASDYLEYTKLKILNPKTETTPFDTIRHFRSDSLILVRTTGDSIENVLCTESISVEVDSQSLVKVSQTIPENLHTESW